MSIEETAGPKPRGGRRLARAALLVVTAAVLGAVGGTAVGYRVQADRAPEALPPLNQPGLAYPAKPLPKGEEPGPLSAKEDRRLRFAGDLRKLLVPRPAGTRTGSVDGWVSLEEYASGYTRPDDAMGFQLTQDIGRVAGRSWWSGEHREVMVHLLQYRSGEAAGAVEFVRDQQDFASGKGDGAGTELKGSGNGRYYLYPVERRAGYLDLYVARAFVQRGDIAIEIRMFDTKKIAEKDIRSLAERQLERL